MPPRWDSNPQYQQAGAADPRLKERGNWDWLMEKFITWLIGY